MKNQRKILIGVLLVSVFFIVTNFDSMVRGRTEIETLYPIMLAGIDRTDVEGDDFLITTISPSTEEDSTKPNNINSMSGKTIFEANRKVGMYAESDIFWGHTMYILIGEDAAREDLLKYMDFIMRDHEPKLTIQPFIVYHNDSQELITNLYSRNIDIISNVERVLANVAELSYSSKINLLEFIDLASQNKDGYMPCVGIEKKKKNIILEQGTEEVKPEKYINLDDDTVLDESIINVDGYALIKDGKVVDFLLKEEGRGLNWLINKIQSGVIIVEHDGVEYNLEITEGNSEINPIIEKGQLRAEIKINVETVITEVDTQDVTFSGDLYLCISEKVEQIIKSEVEEVIKKLQDLNIDIIGLGDKFHNRYPIKWQKEYSDKWEDLFPKTSTSVTVDSVVTGSSNFTDSIFIEKED